MPSPTMPILVLSMTARDVTFRDDVTTAGGAAAENPSWYEWAARGVKDAAVVTIVVNRRKRRGVKLLRRQGPALTVSGRAVDWWIPGGVAQLVRVPDS